jgi:ParB-like chromosome segregation protein Spo0J
MLQSEVPAGPQIAAHAPKESPAHIVTRDVSLALLLEPLDPMRHNMSDEYMLDLQNSIKTNGLFQNLCVVPVAPGEATEWERVPMRDYDAHLVNGGRFRVAAGHRRLLACRAVKHDPVRCIIYVDLTIAEETIMAGENTIREDPTDFDLAVLYTKWLAEPGITESEVKKRAGKSIDFIYGRADLMNGYEFVATALHERKITFAVARELNLVKEPEYAQHFLNMAIDNGLSAKYVRAMKAERDAIRDMTPAAGPGPVQPLHITAPAFQKIECLLCGDTQSYNLQTVMVCGADVERIKAARAAQEAAEKEQDGPVQTV